MRTADDLQRELKGSDEFRLYDLIWKRTVASQMADARIRRVTLLAATSSSGEAVVFQATGRTIEFPGLPRAPTSKAPTYLSTRELEDREPLLPLVERANASTACGVAASGHTTQPPAR